MGNLLVFRMASIPKSGPCVNPGAGGLAHPHQYNYSNYNY